MLAIRLQRTGRKGHAMFRLIVQDARRSPTSGQVVASLGSYDPHAKTVTIVKDKTELYLKNGAQPSPRAARLLKAEGITLPSWVVAQTQKSRAARHPEKLRKNQPAEASTEPIADSTAPAEEVAAPVAAEPAAASEEPKESTESSAEAEVKTEAEAPDQPQAETSAEPPVA